ncbi:MAG TPA: DUF3300 domain-containing protein [Pyrinomonadaceae bacterium]|nr:DUF3300 domain-containing protein [Pyrinomonadaceae bacterium]
MKRTLNLTVRRLAILVVIGVAVLAPGNSRVFAQMPQTQMTETPADVQQLVAPIALYPDELVAQVLAASTYPTQIVEADRWLEQHSGLQGEQLAAQVDQQRWDPSVKALTEFPSVVSNMDKNLSWTTSLGEAYMNDQQDVLDAVQVMRQRAEDAGNLQTNPQQRVTTEGSTIIVEPAVADTCYVPVYDPWVVYGAAVPVYPGYFYDPWYGGPYIAFGRGVHLGFFGGFGWGWPAWGFNWGQRVVVFNRAPFVHDRFFYGRGGYGFRGGFGGVRTFHGFRGGGFRGHGFGGFGGRGFAGRGFGGGFRGGRH